MLILKKTVHTFKKKIKDIPWLIAMNITLMEVANNDLLFIKVLGLTITLLCLVAIISIYGQEQ